MNSARSERGTVIVLVAILLPVFLLITALVVDVGDWYTHKRQLQTRADAGATAAGAAYQQYWAACTGPAGAGQVAALNNIVVAAHQYAGDPNAFPASGTPVYNPLTTPPLNTEITAQPRLNVVLNSTTFDAATDYSDGGDPCTAHPADSISAAGYWTDVKVKEVDVPSLFGPFGLPLSRVGAQARVAIRPAVSDDTFVPLSVPDSRIVKAQARIFNKCTGALLSTIDLSPLKSVHQTAPGTVLWGPSVSGQTTVDPSTISFQLPGSASGCPASQDYVPVSIEIRVGGRPDVDLNLSCSALKTTSAADCFDDLTEFRAYTGGNLAQRPVIGNVNLTPTASSSGCAQDPYFAILQAGQTGCSFDVNAAIDWGTRPAGSGPNSGFSAVLHVGSSNTDYNLVSPGGAPPNGIWTGTSIPIGAVGAKDITIDWNWQGPTSGTWTNSTGTVTCRTGGNNPCRQSGTLTVHRVSLGDPENGVALAEVTNGPNLTSVLGSVQATGGTISPNFFVGLSSQLAPDQFKVLRLGTSQRTYSIICDPRFGQPSTTDQTSSFAYGCRPPYAPNTFDQSSYWWSGQQCPSWSGWFTNGPPFALAPWQCVHLDPGGHGFAVPDGIALRTGNCRNPNIDPPGPGASASCQAHQYQCNNPINYTGPGSMLDPNDPRIVKIYIVPFGAYNGIPSGNVADIPVLDFAAFYITGWEGNGDPCPNNDNAKLNGGVVAGYFIKYVGSGGAVDPTATCDPNQIRPCRAVLER